MHYSRKHRDSSRLTKFYDVNLKGEIIRKRQSTLFGFGIKKKPKAADAPSATSALSLPPVPLPPPAISQPPQLIAPPLPPNDRLEPGNSQSQMQSPSIAVSYCDPEEWAEKWLGIWLERFRHDLTFLRGKWRNWKCKQRN